MNFDLQSLDSSRGPRDPDLAWAVLSRIIILRRGASRFCWTRPKETQGTPGLRDLRERAKLVGAKLAVWSKLVPASFNRLHVARGAGGSVAF